MLGPKEPNLYKNLSQGTVTKGIQIKIFFFENLDLDPDAHPDPDFQKNFFFNFYFFLCHYYEILTNLPLNNLRDPTLQN